MAKKNKSAPCKIPFAFIKAAETYLPRAILQSDRPIAKVFAAAKEEKQVACGVVSKAIDEIEILEEKRKFKLMVAGDLDPADDAITTDLIALLKLAMMGKTAPAVVEAATPDPAALVAVAGVGLPAESDVAQTVPKCVLPSPIPKPTAAPKKIITIKPGAVLAPEAPLEIADDASFSKFAKLKVRLGSDTFSMMSLPRLLAALGDAAADTQREIEALWEQRNEVDSEEYQLSFDDRALSRVLRWHLRGLNIPSAIKKTRVDYQIGKEKQARKEAAACQISQNPVSSS